MTASDTDTTGGHLLNGQFIPLQGCIKIVENTYVEHVLKDIPGGAKTSIAYIVDQSMNLQRLQNGERICRDDCGLVEIWRSFVYYFEHSTGRQLLLRDNLFCSKKTSTGIKRLCCEMHSLVLMTFKECTCI